MKVKGYTIWKPLVRCSKWEDLEKSNNFLVIFLRAFPDLKNDFFSGNEIWIKPSSVHFHFLETEIKNRLYTSHQKVDRKNERSKEIIDFINSSGQIIEVKFLGQEYKLNLFGNSENKVIIDLIDFYNMLKDCNDIFGIKITPGR